MFSAERKIEEKGGNDGGDWRSKGTRNYNLIIVNLTREISQQLKSKDCELYPSMCVCVGAVPLYIYPDIAIVCGEPVFKDNRSSVLTNPMLIVEVYSGKTQAYDRGKKFEHYLAAGSLTEYILFSQDQYRVEQFVKQPDGAWLYRIENSLKGLLELVTIECVLSISEVYDKVILS